MAERFWVNFKLIYQKCTYWRAIFTYKLDGHPTKKAESVNFALYIFGKNSHTKNYIYFFQPKPHCRL